MKQQSGKLCLVLISIVYDARLVRVITNNRGRQEGGLSLEFHKHNTT